jgi:two-component system, cell cycle response regulator
MAPVISNLYRNVNRMKWMNTLCFTAIFPALLILFGNQDLRTSIMVACMGLALGTGNYLFVRNFQIRKIGTELMDSYNKAKNDLLFDELTGVYSRRAGMERLREEFARSHRSQKGFSVAMVDIDHFKKINDTYGHLAGDQVLKEVAQVLRGELRTCDVVLRYGGEEFMVIMPDTDKTKAVNPLERLGKKLADVDIPFETVKIRVSVSIGVTSTYSGSEDLTETINRADKALYDAKKNGRNRVVFGDSIRKLNYLQAN